MNSIRERVRGMTLGTETFNNTLTISGSSDGSTHDPDPERLIFNHTDGFPVPKWASKNSTSTCSSCRDTLQSDHKHTCRLCGYLFCSSCTVKHHLPSRFKLKNKPGASYVCFSDREQCLVQKKEAEERKKSADPFYKRQEEKALRNYDSKLNTLYPMDQWVHKAHFEKCFLCYKRDTEPIPCRVCGRLADSNCVLIVANIPAAFELEESDSKGAVCLECRHFILAKKPRLSDVIRLVEEKPAEIVKSPRTRRKNRQMDYPEAATLPDGEITIEIMWEGAQKVIGSVTVHSSASLADINDMFEEKYPQSQLFHYLCRGKGVHPEWWDIFLAKFLYPKLVLRGGTVSTPTIVVSQGQDNDATEGVPQENNPYLAANRREKKKVAVIIPVEPEILYEFKQPKQAAGNDQIETALRRFAPPAKKAKVRKVVEKTEARPVGDIDAMLLERCKTIFGATS